jgi:hypothetical protein
MPEKFEDLLPPKDQLESLLRPTNAEARAETLEKLLALNRADLTKALDSTQGASPVSSKERDAAPPLTEATEAANSLLKRIGENPELKELARKAGLIP